jgi:copper chaperone CopZ
MKLQSLINLAIAIYITCGFYPMKISSHEISDLLTIRIECKQMECEGCKTKITRSLNKVDGVSNIDIDLESKLITVTYDSEKATVEQILAAIKKAGYEPELVQ